MLACRAKVNRFTLPHHFFFSDFFFFKRPLYRLFPLPFSFFLSITVCSVHCLHCATHFAKLLDPYVVRMGFGLSHSWSCSMQSVSQSCTKPENVMFWPNQSKTQMQRCRTCNYITGRRKKCTRMKPTASKRRMWLSI